MSRHKLTEIINTAVDGDKVYERMLELTDGNFSIYVEDNSNLDFLLKVGNEYEFDLIIDFTQAFPSKLPPFYRNEDSNTFLYKDNFFKLGNFKFSFPHKSNTDLIDESFYRLSVIFLQVRKISKVEEDN